MVIKNRRFYLLIVVGIGLLGCIIGCVNILERYLENYNEEHPSEQHPIKTFSLRIDENQRSKMFSQLQAFSKKNDFEFYLSEYTPEKSFFVVMSGNELEISALSNSVNITELNFRFFEQDPTRPPSSSTIDRIYNELKGFISEIPSVVFIEEE